MEKIGNLQTNHPNLLVKVQNNELITKDELMTLTADLIENNNHSNAIKTNLTNVVSIAALSPEIQISLMPKMISIIKTAIQSKQMIDNQLLGYLGQWDAMQRKLKVTAFDILTEDITIDKIKLELSKNYYNISILIGQISTYVEQAKDAIDNKLKDTSNIIRYILNQLSTKHNIQINSDHSPINMLSHLVAKWCEENDWQLNKINTII